MPNQRRLLAALPFLLLPALILLLTPSCDRGDKAALPPEPIASAAQALGCPQMPQNLDGGGACATLDEFVQLDGVPSSGWTTFTCPTSGACACDCSSGTCDITLALQCSFDALSATSLLLFGGSDAGPNPATVLRIPAGTYTIHDTVMLQGAYGVAVVGDDPGTTIIRWSGPPSATADMIGIRDSQSVKIGRLTLDGALTGPPSAPDGGSTWLAGVRVSQIASPFSVYQLELEDDVFTNLSYGVVVGGGTGYSTSNQASSSVRRSRFRNIFTAGAVIGVQEAYQWLFEDNVFLDCAKGIEDYGGGIIVVNNLFFNDDGSAASDNVNVDKHAPGADVIRGNLSIGADQFYWDASGFQSQTEVSGNYIVLSPSTQHCYAMYLVSGSTTVLDNYIEGKTTAVDQNGDPAPGAATCNDPVQAPTPLFPQYKNLEFCAIGTPARHVTHGGNTYTGVAQKLLCNNGGLGVTVAPSEQCVGGTQCGTLVGNATVGYQLDESTDNADAFGAGAAVPAAAQAALAYWGSPAPSTSIGCFSPPFAPRKTRSVTNVKTSFPSCLSASTPGCAQALTSYLAGAGSGPLMLYFPSGRYYVDGPVEIPPNRDIVVGGDGRETTLFWTGTGTDQYVIHAQAPSQAMIRDLTIRPAQGASRSGGILVDSQDDVGGQVYMDLVQVDSAKDAYVVAGLDNVLVRVEQSWAGAERPYTVIGGGRARMTGSTSASGQTRGLAALSTDGIALSSAVSLRNWGKAVFVGADFEGGNQAPILDQTGYLTMAEARYFTQALVGGSYGYRSFYPIHPTTLIQSTFRGAVTFVDNFGSPAFLAAGAARAQILSLTNAYAPTSSTQPDVPACASGPVDCGGVRQIDAAAGGATQMSLHDFSACGTTTPVYQFPCAAVNNNASAQPAAFAAAMLADLRGMTNAVPVAPLTCGATNVRLHNVAVIGQWGWSSPPTQLMKTAVRVERSN